LSIGVPDELTHFELKEGKDLDLVPIIILSWIASIKLKTENYRIPLNPHFLWLFLRFLPFFFTYDNDDANFARRSLFLWSDLRSVNEVGMTWQSRNDRLFSFMNGIPEGFAMVL
jgi:hypothetical protein